MVVLELFDEDARAVLSAIKGIPALKCLASELDNELQNQDELAAEREHARLMEQGSGESGHYRQSLRDAGRGHLVR